TARLPLSRSAWRRGNPWVQCHRLTPSLDCHDLRVRGDGGRRWLNSALVGFQPAGYFTQAADFSMGWLVSRPGQTEPVEPQGMQPDGAGAGHIIHRMIADMQRLLRLHAGTLQSGEKGCRIR